MPIETVVEGVAEEVADNLEEIADATRSIDTTAVGYFIGGVCIGVGLGFYFGYKFNREKIRAEAFKKSEEEIEKIREMYQQRSQQEAVAIVAPEKPSVESIVEEKGYSTPIPAERPLPAPVPVHDTGGWITRNTYTDPNSPSLLWSYPEEVAKRTTTEPYVIHQDEFNNAETGYNQVTYTYYAQDDVLTGEDDHPLPHADKIVGQENLKWGYGSDDENVVFVRNDEFQLEMEICRSQGSYEQEVLGINDDESS